MFHLNHTCTHTPHNMHAHTHTHHTTCMHVCTHAHTQILPTGRSHPLSLLSKTDLQRSLLPPLTHDVHAPEDQVLPFGHHLTGDHVLRRVVLPPVHAQHMSHTTQHNTTHVTYNTTTQHMSHTTQHNTCQIQHNTTHVKYNTTQHMSNTTHVTHNTTQHSTAQHNTTQHNTCQIQHMSHIPQHNTTQHNTIQHNTCLTCLIVA